MGEGSQIANPANRASNVSSVEEVFDVTEVDMFTEEMDHIIADWKKWVYKVLRQSDTYKKDVEEREIQMRETLAVNDEALQQLMESMGGEFNDIMTWRVW